MGVFSDGGEVPGTMLFTQQIIGVIGELRWFGPSGISLPLGPGTYWIVFSAEACYSRSSELPMNGYMPHPSAAPLGNEAYSAGGWLEAAVLNLGIRILGDDGVPVPAPASLLAAGVPARRPARPPCALLAVRTSRLMRLSKRR